jgi:hypothetical protein
MFVPVFLYCIVVTDLFIGATWPSNIGEGTKSTMGFMNTDACILLPVKVFFPPFFLFLQRPNNSFENIYIFLNAPFNSVAEKIFLGRKKYWGRGICPRASPKLRKWMF